MISRDVIFYESFMLHPRKDNIVVIGIEKKNSKQVKLQKMIP